MTAFTLVPQTFGIAMAQCVFGGPKGVWLECRACDRSEKIKGKGAIDLSDAKAAEVFRKAGWTGVGDRMLDARCPACSNPESPK